MSKLTEAMKDALVQSELLPLATASESGVPNVIPIKFVFVENESELWIVDNFLNKTLNNIRQNPRAALYVYDANANTCIQIKGRLDIKVSGPEFERMRLMVHGSRPDLPAKSLVIMTITDIYQCLPGPDAGEPINQ